MFIAYRRRSDKIREPLSRETDRMFNLAAMPLEIT